MSDSLSGPESRPRPAPIWPRTVIRILIGILALPALTLPSLVLSATGATAVGRPAVQPLRADLESIRAQDAVNLYGSPEIRPIDQRRTSLITMGDSEISGEGVGNYEPGTHQDGNWCDRSLDQAIWRTTVPSDVRYNIACSGAEPVHLQAGGAQQYNELNQGDNLSIRARNTHLKLIWVIVGANGEQGINFGQVAADCSLRRVFFRGPCWPIYTDQWATRVDGTRQQVENTLNSIRRTMTDAGYLSSDYELVLQSYPSPFGPDVEDDPSFRGWHEGGCLLYLADLAFARNKVVPMLTNGMRAAARNTGARFLDASRLFHGHEVCTATPHARGLHIEPGVWSTSAFQQSYHPNIAGHRAFAACMSAFYGSGLAEGTCGTPATNGPAVLYRPMAFKELRNEGTGGCADAFHYDSRNGTQLVSWQCHGGRNQGFWYDPADRSLHVELSHARCLDTPGGGRIQLWDCHGGVNQRWVFEGTRLHPAGQPELCLGLTTPASGDAVLQATACTAGDLRQRWAFLDRNYDSPAGYGYSDFIGSRVY